MIVDTHSHIYVEEFDEDRDEAIKKAITDAKPGDTVLILGKGAERYMMTMGEAVYRPNDIERAEIVLKELGYKG